MNPLDTNKQEGAHLDIASTVLSRITAENVIPTPRYHFLLRDGVVWTLGIGSVVVGAFGVAAILFTARHSEWQFYQATHDSLFSFLVDIIPYTWIVTLGLFAVLSFEFVRHTKRGYRYQVPVLIIASVGASTLLGTVVFALGAGPFIDQKLGAFIPLHRSLHDTKLGFWNQPDRGLVAGVVTDIATTSDSFTVMSPSREFHTIRMDDLIPADRAQLSVGQTIRVFAPLVERTVDEDADGNVIIAATSAQPAMMSALSPRDGHLSAVRGKEVHPSIVERVEANVFHIRKLFREACATILVHEESDDADDAMMEHMFTQCYPGAAAVK